MRSKILKKPESNFGEPDQIVLFPLDEIETLEGRPLAPEYNELARSIEQFGIYKPVQLLKFPLLDGGAMPYIVNLGRDRVIIARSLGWTHIPAVILPGNSSGENLFPFIQAVIESPGIKCGQTEIPLSYAQWRKTNAKAVTIRSYLENKKLRYLFNKDLLPPIKAQACYDNARLIATPYYGMNYVEGFLQIGNRYIQHAWNKIGNFHFDLTREFTDYSRARKEERYFEILSLTADKVEDIHYSRISRYHSFMDYHFLSRFL